MKRSNTSIKPIKRWTIAVIGCCIGLLGTSTSESVEAAEGLGGPPHIGTFEESTTFITTSSNGINPGLYLEVMDSEGNYTEYISEEGVVTLSNTKEGAYVTQAKLLGKTKYVDQVTGEILDNWEEGRDLTLVSSEGPGLTTTGKNLLDDTKAVSGWISDTGVINVRGELGVGDNYLSDYIYTGNMQHVKSNTGVWVWKFDENKNFISLYSTGTTDIDVSDCAYIRIGRSCGANTAINLIGTIQLESGTQTTSYKPYQSNLLTVNEAVELRGFGEVKDELDLLTGEVVERVKEIVFDGSENFLVKGGWENNTHMSFDFRVEDAVKDKTSKIVVISDKFKSEIRNSQSQTSTDEFITNTYAGLIFVMIRKDRLDTQDLNGFKTWLSKEPITVQYQLATESTKIVGLNSTYYFDPVLNREIRVKGTILPLVASVSIPTEPLAFLIDPNQAEGQQFIAPEFSITNQTPVPIDLNLKTFEQTTTILNDVLPETHLNWRQLNQKQSKDIALALVPQPSDGWLSLDEGPRYVADSSNYQLGEVKEESTVEFTFSALHGRAFVKELNPEYRLSFEFGFRSGD